MSRTLVKHTSNGKIAVAIATVRGAANYIKPVAVFLEQRAETVEQLLAAVEELDGLDLIEAAFVIPDDDGQGSVTTDNRNFVAVFGLAAVKQVNDALSWDHTGPDTGYVHRQTIDWLQAR